VPSRPKPVPAARGPSPSPSNRRLAPWTPREANYTGRNPKNIALAVGELFFPQSQSLGIDRTAYSPALQAKIVYAGANNTSYSQAQKDLLALAELDVSDKRTRRLCKTIGAERVAQRDADTAAYQQQPLAQRKAVPEGVTAPPLAVVGVDGGRLQIFERVPAGAKVPQTPPEVIEDDVLISDEAEPTKKSLWREDKIGTLLTMASAAQEADPCPEIPASFVDATWIPQLARELKSHGAAQCGGAQATGDPPDKPAQDPPAQAKWQPPEVTTKHFVATRRPWEAFGPMLAARAWSLGFFGAARQAFIGDGAENNWTLWRGYFSSFVPILDFIHALTYVFHAALAGRPFAEGWQVYLRWIGWVWSGAIEKVIVELAARQAELGVPAADAKESSPAKVVAKALGYLQRNKERMRYAEYRRQGLPIVSSYVESAVKQFNYRVKGTEKFWREAGAEEMLQLRADYLSDGDTMENFWQHRQARETGQARYRMAA
jgi:hypothetical protein